MNNPNLVPHLVKKVCKFKHTVALYHQEWCDMWTMSITPLMASERTARRIVSPKMAAHIIANVDELPFMPVSDSSTRHKYYWYVRIANIDLTDEWVSQIGKKSGTFFYHEQEMFAITAHKKGVNGWECDDEDTKSCMNRMIHG